MNKLTILVGATLLGVSTLSLAQETTPIANGNYFYVSLEGGVANMYTELPEPYEWTSESYDKDDSWAIAGRLSAGFLWQAGNYFHVGFEAGYATYAGNTYTYKIAAANKISIDGYHIDLLGVAKYVIVENLNIFAKAGAAYTHQTYQSDSIGRKLSKNQILPKATLGLGYDFNDNFGVTISYSRVFSTDSICSRIDWENEAADNVNVNTVDTEFLGLVYRFM